MVLLMPTLVLQRPLLLAARGARPALARPLSILGTIFGIGEFEGERNQSLRGSTGKQHAFELALLDVRLSLSLLPWIWQHGTVACMRRILTLPRRLIHDGNAQYVGMNSHPKHMLHQVSEQ